MGVMLKLYVVAANAASMLETDPAQYIMNIVETWVLGRLAWALILLGLAVSVFQFVAGGEHGAEKGKKMLMGTLIGAAIAVGAKFIVGLLQSGSL